jgi:AMP deaminase
MCEISRNSVAQSGWENRIKKHWIGKQWYLPGIPGNDMAKTNVPNIRVAFRYETLREELNMLQEYSCVERPSSIPGLIQRMASNSPTVALIVAEEELSKSLVNCPPELNPAITSGMINPSDFKKV